MYVCMHVSMYVCIGKSFSESTLGLCCILSRAAGSTWDFLFNSSEKCSFHLLEIFSIVLWTSLPSLDLSGVILAVLGLNACFVKL